MHDISLRKSQFLLVKDIYTYMLDQQNTWLSCLG